MVARLKKPETDRDQVVIIDQNGTADIATVYDQDDQSLYAESVTQDYAVPLGDVRALVGPRGRIFMLAADSDYVRDTKRLAALEKSIVLRQVTHFEKPKELPASGLNIRSILLYALVGVLVLAVIFK
jgi:hypothetical protein